MVQFCKPVDQNGRLYFFRSDVERYKRELANLPVMAFEGVDTLVPAAQLALELGVGRRTIGRRIREAALAAASRLGSGAPTAVAAE